MRTTRENSRPSEGRKCWRDFPDVANRRLVAMGDLSAGFVTNNDWSFSDVEKANIAAYLAKTRRQAADMFDLIMAN